MKSGRDVRSGFRWSPQRWFGAQWIWTPDLGGMIQELKGLGCCAFDSQAKTWWFPEHFYIHVEGIMRTHLGDANVEPLYGVERQWQKVDRSASVRRPTWREGDTPYETLGLISMAPDSVVKAAFKALCEELDPERGGVGGSYEPIERVRAAYEKIKAERGF